MPTEAEVIAAIRSNVTLARRTDGRVVARGVDAVYTSLGVDPRAALSDEAVLKTGQMIQRFVRSAVAHADGNQ